jgi:hypothetical protein
MTSIVKNEMGGVRAPEQLCLATIQNAPGAVHTQEFADIRT